MCAGRDAVTGQKRWVTRTVKGAKREAARALADLLEQWFAFACDDFSPKTVLETRGFMDRNLLPALGPVALSRLTTHDIDRHYRHLRKRGAQDGGELQPAAIRRIHGILRRAVQQGVRWGWIPVNPAAAVTPPRADTAELVPPPPMCQWPC